MASVQRHLARLGSALGRQAAAQELRWMREAAKGESNTDNVLEQMVARRLRGEPLQYILGTQPFGPLELRVRPPVLIPRPETEHWALRLHELLKDSETGYSNRPRHLLDLCTGTGCIPILLAYLAKPGTLHTLGVDISSDAIALATENATLVGGTLLSDDPPVRADCRTQPININNKNVFTALHADILSPNISANLAAHRWAPFDVITANPPYIPKVEYDALDRSVRDFEDKRALLGDPQENSGDGRGLTFYRAIAQLVGKDTDGKVLRTDGLVALEVGHDQAEKVRMIMETTGKVGRTEVWEDAWGIARTVVCWR